MLSYKTRREREVGKARRRELVIGRAFASHVSSVRYHGGRGSKRQTRSVDWTYEIARQSSGLRRFVRFTWSLEKTHLTLIQRCALTVQLHPSIAHIPGGALSTLPTRNTKQHRDTDHTIARSRFGPFGHTLHTLLPPLMLSAIHHHHPRSSSGEQKAALFHPDRSPSILPRGDLSSHRSRHTVIPVPHFHLDLDLPRSTPRFPFASSSSRSHLSPNSSVPGSGESYLRTKGESAPLPSNPCRSEFFLSEDQAPGGFRTACRSGRTRRRENVGRKTGRADVSTAGYIA